MSKNKGARKVRVTHVTAGPSPSRELTEARRQQKQPPQAMFGGESDDVDQNSESSGSDTSSTTGRGVARRGSPPKKDPVVVALSLTGMHRHPQRITATRKDGGFSEGAFRGGRGEKCLPALQAQGRGRSSGADDQARRECQGAPRKRSTSSSQVVEKGDVLERFKILAKQYAITDNVFAKFPGTPQQALVARRRKLTELFNKAVGRQGTNAELDIFDTFFQDTVNGFRGNLVNEFGKYLDLGENLATLGIPGGTTDEAKKQAASRIEALLKDDTYLCQDMDAKTGTFCNSLIVDFIETKIYGMTSKKAGRMIRHSSIEEMKVPFGTIFLVATMFQHCLENLRRKKLGVKQLNFSSKESLAVESYLDEGDRPPKPIIKQAVDIISAIVFAEAISRKAITRGRWANVGAEDLEKLEAAERQARIEAGEEEDDTQ
ncbi:hypothetical protein DFJ74DRAFT_650980 [Hyaloraphidium curvatum]|nr:hypothetical protein DFJ74DRAFT_650980 [Hyaloraphidium curvatum]